MFGLPLWLAEIILNLITAVGLPLAKKLIPSVPAAVWQAIQDILKHINGQPSTESKQMHAEKLRQAVDGLVNQRI